MLRDPSTGLRTPRNDGKKGLRFEYEGNTLLIVEEIASRLFKSLRLTPETFSFYCDAPQFAAGGVILRLDVIDIDIYTIDNSHFRVI